MQKKTVRVQSKMPARPDWVRVNSTISFPLRSVPIKKLAEAFLEAQEAKVSYANVEVSFTGGLDIMLEVSYELS